ncbi:hypothetical protein Bbelb_166230 [Branchiostoma belcheri]|nr:hypothetical protein Bbelb_166230 [Branchiostoma belcheri]
MERYRILEELGQGAFGKVYKAERKEDGSALALKCLTVDSLDVGQVVLKEIIALQQAVGKHPHILQFIGLMTADAGLNTPVLNMCLIVEYCDGGTLDRFILRARPSRATVLQLLCDTAEGVAYLHSRNVDHGALKPDNILVDNSGQRPIVKVVPSGALIASPAQCNRPSRLDTRLGAQEVMEFVASEVSQHIHIESPGHTVDLEGVRILDTEQDYFKRGIKEAIYIRALQPSLNRDGGRYRLQTTFDPLLTSHIADFGLARVRALGEWAVNYVQTMVMYMPPELLLVMLVAKVMITHPEFPVADMLMTSEPQGSPVKALVLAMLAVDPRERPTSEQVLCSLMRITGASDGVVVSQPTSRSHTVVQVPTENEREEGNDDLCRSPKSCKDCIPCCCAMCFRIDGNDCLGLNGVGIFWQLLSLLIGLVVFAVVLALIILTDGKFLRKIECSCDDTCCCRPF